MTPSLTRHPSHRPTGPLGVVHVRCWQTRQSVIIRPGSSRTATWAVNLVLASQRATATDKE